MSAAPAKPATACERTNARIQDVASTKLVTQDRDRHRAQNVKIDRAITLDVRADVDGEAGPIIAP